jgi:hypothetical protein
LATFCGFFFNVLLNMQRSITFLFYLLTFNIVKYYEEVLESKDVRFI